MGVDETSSPDTTPGANARQLLSVQRWLDQVVRGCPGGRSRSALLYQVGSGWRSVQRLGATAHLASRPAVVLLPAQLEGGNATDARMLKTLWTTLMETGVPIQREKEPPR